MEKHVLEGVRVLDFTWAVAGGFGTLLLAQSGAEVIKVESVKRLDSVRFSRPLVGNNVPNNSAGFGFQSASKYGITLNLADPRGLEIAKQLVRISDVVAENFRTGKMKKMGLGYEELKSLKPDIIMLSSSVLGEKGASWAFGGFGPHGSALSGYPHLTGWSDRPPNYDADVSVGYSDTTQSLLMGLAAMIALDYKRRTGKGQHIDLSHPDILVQFISPAILDYMVNGRKQQRMGNRSLNASPHGAFPCKGVDRWCVIAVFTNEEWNNFCQALGQPFWVQDSKFATLESRRENEDELEKLISAWTINYTPEEIMHKLQSSGVAAGVVQDMIDLMERDPQVKAREVFTEVNHSVLGPYKFPLPPFRLGERSFSIRPAPTLGEHNDYVYRELLGLSNDEFRELSDAGVLA